MFAVTHFVGGGNFIVVTSFNKPPAMQVCQQLL